MFSLNGVAKILAILAVASAPLAVVEAFRFPNTFPFQLLLLWIACCVLAVYLLTLKKIALPPSATHAIILIYVPFMLALSLGAPTAQWVSNLGVDYSGYLELSWGRLMNAFVLAIFFIGVLTLIKMDVRNSGCSAFAYHFARVYWAATGVFLIAAIWHGLHFYLGAHYPFPETRTHVHGVPVSLQELVAGRVTGLASEPSFLVPFVIDFAIISILFSKGVRLFSLLMASAVVVFISFSVAGYLNLIIILFFGLLLLLIRVIASKKVHVASIGMVFFIVTIVTFSIIGLAPYLELVTARIGSALHPDHYARSFMVLMPFYWMADAAFINIVFGHGPKSYAMIGEVVKLPISGEPVHITSNNLFVDIIWEHGMVGLLGILGLFVMLAAKTRAFFRTDKESAIAFLLLIHLLSTSLYRGDFFSLRFFVVLLIIIFLIEGLVSEKTKTGVRE